MKNGSGKNKIAKTVALIILIVGVFALLVLRFCGSTEFTTATFPPFLRV